MCLTQYAFSFSVFSFSHQTAPLVNLGVTVGWLQHRASHYDADFLEGTSVNHLIKMRSLGLVGISIISIVRMQPFGAAIDRATINFRRPDMMQ